MNDVAPTIPDEACLRRLAERMPELHPDAVRCVAAVRFVAAELDTALQASLDTHGISFGRLRVLTVLLEKDEPTNHSDITANVGVTKGTMTGLIDGLERDGLVKRTAAEQDRRASLVKLTPKGRRLIMRVLPEHLNRLTDIAGGLSSTEQRTLTRLVFKLHQHLVGTQDDAPQRL